MSADDKLGSIVAFEGRGDTISTQLRLLPSSPRVLILPSVQSYISDEGTGSQTDVRVYVKKIHEAAVARYDAAQVFLQGSTPNSKRLVFMHGGTPSAQALCIKTIMDHETDGDYPRAELLFNQLVRDGVAGLNNPVRDWRRQNTFDDTDQGVIDENLEDPITRAMRAADALDRQTANLQPSNDLDLTVTTRPRSNSLPLYGYDDNFGDDAPFFVFGARGQGEGRITADEAKSYPHSPQTSRFSVRHYDQSAGRICRGVTNLQSPSMRNSFLVSPSCIGESYDLKAAPISPGPEGLSPRSDIASIPSTDNVVYGEASLLVMRSSSCASTLSRIKSLDRIYLPNPKYQDSRISTAATEFTQQPDHDLNHEHSRLYRLSQATSLNSTEFSSDRRSIVGGCRTIVVKNNIPIIKVAPVPLGKKRKPARASYVDRGTDAEKSPEPKETFQPVLSLTEDLVVHIKEDVPDPLLNSVIRGLRMGHFPVVYSPASVADEGNGLIPKTPRLEVSANIGYAGGGQGKRPPNTGQCNYPDEYDPFAYEPTWLRRKPLPSLPRVDVQSPPTPVQTPPPLMLDFESKIHDLSINSQQTAITVQNSLRSVLQNHIPPENHGYRQFQFPLLPELEGLWKPVFWETEPDRTHGSGRRVDQILAFGAQRGVKRDYASAIAGRLEKLGCKHSGMSRSGRLDFRYLLANAMQTYTAQPLTSQTQENPFTNSFLLATLIVPHLETYIALHAEVRFLLLEYPPEHLSTVLALQKLVGVEMMKVAQIVDASSKNMPFTHLRGNSITRTEQGPIGRVGKTFPLNAGTGYNVTVSKANFLLTSNASDAEISTFIGTISKILSKISDFYISEELPRKPSPKKSKPTSITGTFSAFPRVPSAPYSPPMSPTPGASLGTAFGGTSTANPSRAPSIAETVGTTKSNRSKPSRTKSKSKTPAADTRSILTMYVDDSDWDQEDRRVMPLLERKSDRRKANTHKALKFLGLS
ncbi:gastric mucin [Fusarium heterosporum]|uniref:Gastric mucin n=1 Tax=Fusarium heterosporum TaxID=42747 RepID=A0A8H5SYD9_FUSHE|nr:gastric mucin [Fusarium heterosporum]